MDCQSRRSDSKCLGLVFRPPSPNIMRPTSVPASQTIMLNDEAVTTSRPLRDGLGVPNLLPLPNCGGAAGFCQHVWRNPARDVVWLGCARDLLAAGVTTAFLSGYFAAASAQQSSSGRHAWIRSPISSGRILPLCWRERNHQGRVAVGPPIRHSVPRESWFRACVSTWPNCGQRAGAAAFAKWKRPFSLSAIGSSLPQGGAERGLVISRTGRIEPLRHLFRPDAALDFRHR